MTATDRLTDTTTIVVGASRGLGRGIATALADAGAPVIAVVPQRGGVGEPAGGGRPSVARSQTPATHGAGCLLDRHQPRAVILVAGATPLLRPLQEQTWETFSANWHADVRITFQWLREALLRPLPPGSRVVVFSGGAALFGSPLSGGYAGSKATQRFLTGYAQDESRRAGLDITFTALLPKLTPATELGAPAVRAYAARSGRTEEDYIRHLGEPLTPEVAGAAVSELVRADPDAGARVPADRRRAAAAAGASRRPIPFRRRARPTLRRHFIN